MPVGYSSPARNLFLLGSSGADVVTNFFKQIEKDTNIADVYVTSSIKFTEYDEKYLLSGHAQNPNSKSLGFLEKRQEDGTQDWESLLVNVDDKDVFINDLEVDQYDNLIVVGEVGTDEPSVPFISRYNNNGVLDWQSTTNTADLRYLGVTCSGNNYYACGHTGSNTIDSEAFVEKYDANGNPVWGKHAKVFGSEIFLNAIHANSRGAVVVGGFLNDESGIKGYFAKLDQNTGDVLWDRTLEHTDRLFGFPQAAAVTIQDIHIDGKDFIYVVGCIAGNGEPTSSGAGFICKYTPEGNMLWQKETPDGSTISAKYLQTEVDTATGQIVILGRVNTGLGNTNGILVKYNESGDLIFTRMLSSNHQAFNTFGNLNEEGNGVALSADSSFYYVLFTDESPNTATGRPNSYTFGKVSTSGNGLGDFTYNTGATEIDPPLQPRDIEIEYTILNQFLTDRIGRLTDGSVRYDTSDLATNILNPTRIMFDDFATPIASKKRQMDSAGSFQYSGSPAVRTVDFKELSIGEETIDITEFVNGSPTGQAEFTTPGSYTWTAPAGVTSVCAVCVGGGGGGTTSGNFAAGGGGGLGWKNNISVTPGQSYTVVVGAGGTGTSQGGTNGGDSYFVNASTVKGGGGSGNNGGGGDHVGDGGGDGGNHQTYGGGGGAGGYSGDGNSGTGGCGGSGGSNGLTGGGAGGGGVGLLGEGSSGSNAGFINTTGATMPGGGGGSGGSSGTAGRVVSLVNGSYQNDGDYGKAGGEYGGGSGGAESSFDSSIGGTDGQGGKGGVRIIWGQGRAFPSTLTADQTPAAGGLVEQTETKVKDLTGKGRHGIINGATFNAAGYWEFDGTSSSGKHIEVDLPNNFLASNFSVEFWFRGEPNAPTSGAQFIAQQGRMSPGNGDLNAAWRIERNNLQDGTIEFGVMNGVSFSANELISTNFPDNIWHHCVCVYKDGSRLIFKNGELDTSTSAFTGTPTHPHDDMKLRIGARADSSLFGYRGDIGEFRIYERALTSSQVFQNYNATKSKYINETPDTAPKIGPGIVYGSNLKLSYDFGNRATYDRAENVVGESEDFTTTGSGRWASAGNVPDANVTANYAMSPFGEMKATRMFNNDSTPKFRRWQPNIAANGSYDTSGQWTCSVYAKALSNPCVLRINSYDGVVDRGSFFDLVDGVVTMGYGSSSNNIEAVGDGWYRISQTTSNAAAGGDHQLHLDPGADLLVFGAQMEKGSTAGRYIRTYGTAITAPTTLKNLSSSSYTGTLNGPTLDSDGYLETDGSSDNITIPGLTLSGSGGFTVEMWMKFTGFQSGTGWNYFVRDEDGLTPPQYEIGVYNNDNYSFIFKQNSIQEAVSTVLTQNQWHHICFGLNASTQQGFIYRDGVYGGGSNNSFSTGDLPLYKMFGDFATNTGIAGQFGEIRGYDAELSPAQILQNFNATRSKYGV